MSLRVLGGKFKGRPIEVPSSGTRPTSVLLKRRLFDALQSLEGYHFVDLCAGSGAVGLEALSRGADSVTFVDIGKKQVNLIKKNINNILKPEESKSVEVCRCCANDWLIKNRESFKNEMIIFFDPPYEEEALYFSFLEAISGYSNKSLFLVEVGNKTSFYEKLEAILVKFDPKKLRQGEREIFWF